LGPESSGRGRFPGDFIRKLCSFFAAVPGALRGHLNVEELARIAVTAVSAGGGIFGVLHAVAADAGVVFPAPPDAALAAALLTMILEGSRRLDQGTSHLGPPCPPAGRLRPRLEDRQARG